MEERRARRGRRVFPPPGGLLGAGGFACLEVQSDDGEPRPEVIRIRRLRLRHDLPRFGEAAEGFEKRRLGAVVLHGIVVGADSPVQFRQLVGDEFVARRAGQGGRAALFQHLIFIIADDPPDRVHRVEVVADAQVVAAADTGQRRSAGEALVIPLGRRGLGEVRRGEVVEVLGPEAAVGFEAVDGTDDGVTLGEDGGVVRGAARSIWTRGWWPARRTRCR